VTETTKHNCTLAAEIARPLDVVIRELSQLRGEVRDARTVSKIMLQVKLEKIESQVRRIEDQVEKHRLGLAQRPAGDDQPEGRGK